MPAPSYERGAHAEYTWSARFDLDEPLTRQEIIGRLGTLVAAAADTTLSISGCILGRGESPTRRTVFLGLHPSRLYGTPSVARCDALAAEIVATQGWRQTEDWLPELRVMLGRRVGYGPDADVYSMHDVRRNLDFWECSESMLTEGDLFSVRYLPSGKVRSYVEPGVMVEASARSLSSILDVAAEMGQEQLVAEFMGFATQVYEER